jgi:hypothetical protein
MLIRSAARRKLWFSATAKKYLRCRSSKLRPFVTRLRLRQQYRQLPHRRLNRLGVGREISCRIGEPALGIQHLIVERNSGYGLSRMHMQTEMVETISTARNRLFNEVLAEWSTTERRDLTRLLRKLVDSANQALLAAETELR